jgi:hypothetical protein
MLAQQEPQQNYPFYKIKEIRGKEYIIRTLVPDDVPSFIDDLAGNYVMFHPEFTVIENLSPERARAFLEKKYRHTARSEVCVCAVDKTTNQVVATMLATDEGDAMDCNEADWPEFYKYNESEALIRKTYSKIFEPGAKGVTSMLSGAWTHSDYMGLGLYKTLENTYWELPKMRTFKYVGGVTVHGGAKKVSRTLKNVVVLMELHYSDLKDSKGNYLYRDMMDKFTVKGFNFEELRFTFFIHKSYEKHALANIKPKL